MYVHVIISLYTDDMIVHIHVTIATYLYSTLQFALYRPTYSTYTVLYYTNTV